MPLAAEPGIGPEREAGWVRCDADEVGDVLVAAMAHGGIDHLFFNSGSDVLFLQEAVAKAESRGLPAPRLITVLHEAVGLNAALGVAAVTGGPVATAAHVEVGTLNYGCALHAASAAGAPVLMLAGSPATAYPGTTRGGRDEPIYWVQEQQDQREIARPYSKWLFRLEMQHNAGLVISRGLQVALSPPTGPAFLTVPREVAMATVDGTAAFPGLDELGLVSPSGPDPESIDRLAAWLIGADRPLIITGRSGREPATVPELVRLAELIGAAVTDNGYRQRLNFPSTHPLLESGFAPSESDLVLVIDREIPWVPAGTRPYEELPDDRGELDIGNPWRAPRAGCRIAWIAEDPALTGIPLCELAGDLRIAASPLLALRALVEAVEDRLDGPARARAGERLSTARARKAELEQRHRAIAHQTGHITPIDPRWLAYQLAAVVDESAILLDESLGSSPLLRRYHRGDRPGSFYSHDGSGGGWGSGAALGAKMAAPEHDVILASGDGFYAYGSPGAALWSAVNEKAPFLSVVFVNSRYSTGTQKVSRYYPGGHAEAGGFRGGRFEPPPDFATEARSVGAHGQTVSDPAELEGTLRRGLEITRGGQPAVVAVRIA